jgi:hypothetical protein
MPNTYRLLKETSVVVTKDGKPDIITIPEGGVITVHEAPLVEAGLVPVEWESQTVKMFAVDLERRAKLVREAS